MKLNFLHGVFINLKICFFACLFIVACSDSGKIKSGNAEQKPKSNVSQNAEGASDEDGVIEEKPIAKAVYKMEVYARYKQSNEIKLCNGSMDAIVMHPVSLKPSGVIECAMLGKMDLSKMFPAKSSGILKEDMKQFKGFGMVSRNPNPADGKFRFSPPLPFLLGPVIQDHNSFKNFQFEERNIQLFVKDGSDGKSVQTKGHIRFEVIDHKTSYDEKVKNVDEKLNSVIHYRRSAEGFDAEGIKKTDYFLFDEFEIWYNSQPIVVPKLQLTADVTALMGGGFISNIGSKFLGPLTIVLTIESHTVL